MVSEIERKLREYHTALLAMFEPIRGGTRGGQAEFKWSDVSADKDREVRTTTYILFAAC